MSKVEEVRALSKGLEEIGGEDFSSLGSVTFSRETEIGTAALMFPFDVSIIKKNVTSIAGELNYTAVGQCCAYFANQLHSCADTL